MDTMNCEPVEIEENNLTDRILNKSALNAFVLLRSDSEDKKILGISEIISFLFAHQENESEFNYTLRRLVQGVDANDVDIRNSYYSALVLLLKYFKNIEISNIIGLLKSELNAEAASKSKAGDVAVGQMLVCGAIMRSGRLLQATEDECNQITNMFFSACAKKSYLYTAGYLFMVNFMDQLDKDQFKSLVWNHIKSTFSKPLEEHSLDSLYFLMTIKAKYPKIKTVGCEDFITNDTVQTICNKMMQVSDFNATNHPVYEFIGKEMANSPILLKFWTKGIDTHLIKHNRNREIVALNLIITIYDNMKCNYEVIPKLLTKNFINLTMDRFRGLEIIGKVRKKGDDENERQATVKKAKDFLNALLNVLKSGLIEDNTRLETLQKLLIDPGDLNFSEVSGTNVLQSIIADLEANSVKKLAKILKSILMNETNKNEAEDKERPWNDKERLKASELLANLVSHHSIAEDIPWRLEYIQLLMCFSFFKISEDLNSTTELNISAKSNFYRCLNVKMQSLSVLHEILQNLCDFLNQKLTCEDFMTNFSQKISEKTKNCWKNMKEITIKIENTENKTKLDYVFLILFYQLGLFLFSDPQYIEIAHSSIQELESCYKHCKNKKNQPNKRKLKEGSVISNNEPEWIEVLIEVLLSLLSNDSNILRSIVQCAFSLLLEFLTPSSINQIVSVLDPEIDSNPLADEDSDGSDSSADENDSDNEVNVNSETKNDSDTGESDIEIPSEVTDDEETMNVPEKLRMAVRKALGTAAPDTDTESIDADMIDEEEGKKINEALSQAFKALRGGKIGESMKNRKDKKTLADFRIRVLDLIDIYVEKSPSMEICLTIIMPLVRCLESALQDVSQKELEKRVRKTIKNLTKLRKFSSIDGVSSNMLAGYLNDILNKENRSHFVYQALADVITACGTFIIQCSLKLKLNPTENNPLTKIYEQCFESFFSNINYPLPIMFFHSILQIDWASNFIFLHVIIRNAFNLKIRNFRRQAAIELLCSYYNNLKRLQIGNVVESLIPLEEELQKSLNDFIYDDNQFSQVKPIFVKVLNKLQTSIQEFYKVMGVKSSLNFSLFQEAVQKNKSVKKNKIKQNGANHVKAFKGGPSSVETNGINKKRRKSSIDQQNNKKKKLHPNNSHK